MRLAPPSSISSDRLLCVHSVFRLVEDDGLWPIEHRIRYFCIAVSRKTVHEDRIRLSMRHQGFVHLIGLEDRRPLRSFMLEAHARADIGIDRVCADNCLDRIVQQRDAAAGVSR